MLDNNSVHTRGGMHCIHSRKFFSCTQKRQSLIINDKTALPLPSWACGPAKTLKVSTERLFLSVVAQSLSHVWLFSTHGLQHAGLPCSSLFPGICSNSCPLSQWCYPTISSSAALFSSCLPFFPASVFFSNESALRIRWLEYWSFSFSISPSNEYFGLISFRIDCFDLLAVQGTLKSLPQHHSSKASILWC